MIRVIQKNMRDIYRKIKDAIFLFLNTGFIHIFGSMVFRSATSFVIGVLLVRLLPKDIFGTYSYAFNILSIVMIFSGLGVSSALLQKSSESDNQLLKNKLFNYSNRFGVKNDVLMFLFILILGIMIPFPVSGANTLFLMMGLLPLLNLILYLQQTHLRVSYKNREYGFSVIFLSILLLILSPLFAFLFSGVGVILSSYISTFCTIIFVSVKFHVVPSFKKVEIKKNETKDLFKIGLLSLFNNGLSQILYLADLFILGIVLTDSEVIASYKVATIIPSALIIIPSAVLMYVYPYFARKQNDYVWLKKNYFKLSLTSGVFYFLISLFLFLFAPLIITTLYGNQYSESIGIFRVLSISFFISATFRITSGNILVTQRKLSYNSINAVISGVLAIILNSILITRYGSIGAAYSQLLTVIVTSIISLFLLKLSISSKKILPSKL